MARTAEVTRSRRERLGSIPQEVIEHFADRGEHVRTAHVSDHSVLLMARLECTEVTEKDLDEDLMPILKRYAFKPHPDGSIRRGDTALYRQPQDIREEIFQENEEHFRRLTGDHDERIKEMDDQAQRTGGARVGTHRKSTRSPLEHIQLPR